MKQTRRRRRGGGAKEGEGHRRWLSETPRPHDQCHGAFIVLQQKGAHQSTGISSRLISRGHPLVLARFSFLPPTPLQPQSLRQPFFPSCRVSFSRILLRGSASSAFLLPTFRHPSSGGRSARGASGRPGGRRQIAGRRSRAVVMKTYEIYSIWADAITPPADRDGGQPPSDQPPRIQKQVCSCARVDVCLCTRCGTSSS